jgi:O-acetyl-ADP-ribose deacetylase (regulator of RNase III)
MSRRITFRAGDPARETADAIVAADALALDSAAPEDALRAAMRRELAAATARGARTLVVPALGVGRLSLQRAAEIQLEEARAHLAGETSLEEIRFVLSDEPALRVFEAVQDGFRIAEQARRWSS